MKKLIISILPIFMSLCVNAQIKLKGVRLYSNTYYYELKDVFVDTKGEQFTLESMRIMFYSPNGSEPEKTARQQATQNKAYIENREKKDEK